MIELNNEQAAALEAIEKWLKPEDVEQFFVLSGSAGTGKTTLVRQLSDKMRGRLVFTAPTNKATRVLHPEFEGPYKRRCEQYAEAAKLDKRKWRFFWDFKESFHSLRHAYAITAHRAQGSTYDTALVDMRDILLNQTRREAFQCLYVACTRPKKRLFVG